MTTLINCGLKVKNGNLDTLRNITNQARREGCEIYSGTQQMTATAAALVIQSADIAAGGITQQGIALILNLDDSTPVQIGVDDGGTFRRFALIRPGEFAAFPVKSGEQLYGRTAGGNAVIEHTAIER